MSSMDPVRAPEDDPVTQAIRLMHGNQTMAKVAEASSVLGPRHRMTLHERGMSLRKLAGRVDL